MITVNYIKDHVKGFMKGEEKASETFVNENTYTKWVEKNQGLQRVRGTQNDYYVVKNIVKSYTV